MLASHSPIELLDAMVAPLEDRTPREELLRSALLGLVERLNLGLPASVGPCGRCGDRALLYTCRRHDRLWCYSCGTAHGAEPPCARKASDVLDETRP